MAALTQDRDASFGEKRGQKRQYPVAANAVIYRGALIAVNATGYAVPATDTAAEVVVGVAEDGIDNTGGGDGDATAIVRRGEVAWFPTSGGNAIDQADVGRSAYVSTDWDVLKAAGVTNNIIAGEVLRLETVGSQTRVWLKVGDA